LSNTLAIHVAVNWTAIDCELSAILSSIESRESHRRISAVNNGL
jgi:hypothetical protein